jgi:uncharacterized membrane protein YdjX (TVP38/TMEM64 family)
MDDTTKITPTAKEPSWADVLKSLAFIVITIGVAYFVTVRVGIENIRETVELSGIYAPLLIILLKATTLIVVPLGGTPLYPIAGAIFGFWQGLGITLIGDLIGSTVCFYLSRYFGISILNFFMSAEHSAMVRKIIDKASDKITFLKARVFFTGFPELFAYAAGFTKIPFWFFLPVHVGIHAVPAGIWTAFGDLLVSGNKLMAIGAGLVTSILAMGGIWWFQSDLRRAD